MARAKKGHVSALKISNRIIFVAGDDLLVHRFSSKALFEMIGKNMHLAKAGDEARDPQLEYVRAINLMSSQRFGFPSRGFKSVIVRGADITGMMPMTKAKMSIFVKGEKVSSALGGDRMIEIVGVPAFHSSVVRLPGGASALRFRGMFSGWAAAIPVEFNEAVISIEQITQMLLAGGYGCGIGEDRPGKSGGEFGTFKTITEKEYADHKKRADKERVAWFKTHATAIAGVEAEDRRLVDLLLKPEARVALDTALRSAGKVPKGKAKLVNGNGATA